MKRFVIITVGKTHSGKSTFARALHQHLPNSIVIDQDNQAEFITAHYRALLPKTGANTFKYALTETIIDYAVHQTDLHLIVCNSNRYQEGKMALLESFHTHGFTSILVNFTIPDEILAARVAITKRSTAIFRSATSFEDVLLRQRGEESTLVPPSENEADYFFNVSDDAKTPAVIEEIINLQAQR